MNVEVNNYSPARWSLKVNGVVIGKYYGGEDKKYLNPDKWAAEQLPKRLKVIDRNITRLVTELEAWATEKENLTR